MFNYPNNKSSFWVCFYYSISLNLIQLLFRKKKTQTRRNGWLVCCLVSCSFLQLPLLWCFFFKGRIMVCISNIWFRSIWQQFINSVFVVELQIKLFLYFLMISLSFTRRLNWACSTAWLEWRGNPVHHVVVTHSVF